MVHKITAIFQLYAKLSGGCSSACARSQIDGRVVQEGTRRGGSGKWGVGDGLKMNVPQLYKYVWDAIY